MSAPWPKLKRGIVAILRGLAPDEAQAVGRAVFEAGIEAIEVPLNSPEPFRSIEAIVADLPGSALVGAGTVLTVADVERLHAVGGRLLVSPNVDPAVLARAADFSIVTMPGRVHADRGFPGDQVGRLGAEILSGERARRERHCGDRRGAAEGYRRRRGRRRFGG